MKITATREDQVWTVVLSGVEPKTIVDVRIQNTMTGRPSEQFIESGADGNANIHLPDFGQNYAITVRVLNSSPTILYPFYFDPITKPNVITMSTSVKPPAVKEPTDTPHIINNGGK